jgi:hypothetical protein
MQRVLISENLGIGIYNLLYYKYKNAIRLYFTDILVPIQWLYILYTS